METSPVSVRETLLPALVQCFGIIFIGFILGKLKILRPTEARGLSVFVQYLSLPALIFTTVSTIPFTKVKWGFIAAIFVAKACIFMFVSLITMLLTHPINLGKSALYAITATQSNDFALGYPLLVALYQNTHPEYPSYLYIIAPIQLLVLNSVAFFMLEMERAGQSRQENCHLWHVLKGTTIKNPVIVMTVLGLIWNISYGQNVLPIFENILKAFASAFPASALLLVGYTMTAKSEKHSSQISLSVLLLILTKNLILPLILQKLSTLMLQGNTATEIKTLSSFGFLYGTIPTAPTAYVFAVQYDTCISVVTKAVVGSTLFAAPLMFASASVISLAQIGFQNITLYLSQTISYISVVNIVCCVWSIIILWVGKRFRSISFGIIFYLIFAQFLMALGGILLFFSPEDFQPTFFAQYILTNGGMYATRASAFLLGALLLTIRVRSLCFILRYKKQINILSVVICLITPYFTAASLLLCKGKTVYGPNFQLGSVQIVATFVLTFIFLTGTIACLIMHQIYLRRHRSITTSETRPGYYQNTHLDTSSETCTLPKSCGDIEDIGINIRAESDPLLPGTSYERLCSSYHQCSTAQRMECNIQVAHYVEESSEIGTGLVDDEYFFKHIVLLILLSLAMTVSLFVCLWKLVLEDENGIFIELEFLDVILNYSLGIVCFVMFGLETNLLSKLLQNLKLSGNQRGDSEHSEESKRICEMFLTNHYNRCKRDIGELKLINDEYSCIFSISDLADWLVNANVIQNAEEVKSFLKCLVNGQLVEKKCNQFKCLSDADLYVFTDYNLSMSI